MLKWRDLVQENTMAEMVDAWNDNTESSRVLNTLVSEININGPIYTGRETVAGYGILPLQEVPVKGQLLQSNTVFDNWNIFFKDKEDIVKLEQFPVDLRAYNDCKPHFLFVDSNLNYRVSNYMFGRVNETILCRFIINTNLTWNQLYICAQRQGAVQYYAADEFFEPEGLDVDSPSGLKLSHHEGVVKRAGIEFTDRLSPDLAHFIQTEHDEIPIRYVNAKNEVDYTQEPQSEIITNKVLSYSTVQKNTATIYEKVRLLKAYYFGIDDFCKKSAEILHDILVAGATLQEAKDYINAFSTYLDEIATSYNQILQDLTNYSMPVSSQIKNYMQNGVSKIQGYSNTNFKGLTSVNEDTVEAIRDAYYLVLPMNAEINPSPVDEGLADLMEELDSIQISNGTFRNVPTGQYSIQRVSWDVYENCFVVQYGDTIYETLEDALYAGTDLPYQRPWGRHIYITLAVLFIKSGTTDLNGDTDEKGNKVNLIVQIRDNMLEVVDSTARWLIIKLQNYLEEQLKIIWEQFEIVNQQIQNLQQQINNVNSKIDNLLFITKAYMSNGRVIVQLSRALKSGESVSLYNIEGGGNVKTINTVGSSTLTFSGVTIPDSWGLKIN